MGLIIHLCGVVAAGVLASTIVALSQHGSKAGSNDKSVNCNSFLHAWPEGSGTAAEHCRREGCIRHRLTLAHHDRPKLHARLPEGVGLLWARPRGKSYDNSHQGHRRLAVSSCIIHLCGVVIARTRDIGGLHKASIVHHPIFFCWVEEGAGEVRLRIRLRGR